MTNGDPMPVEASPQEVIRHTAVSQDYTVLRFAVLGLIVSNVLALLGVVVLSVMERDVPEGVIAIGSASVGALSTMLVRNQIGGS